MVSFLLTIHVHTCVDDVLDPGESLTASVFCKWLTFLESLRRTCSLLVDSIGRVVIGCVPTVSERTAPEAVLDIETLFNETSQQSLHWEKKGKTGYHVLRIHREPHSIYQFYDRSV